MLQRPIPQGSRRTLLSISYLDVERVSDHILCGVPPYSSFGSALGRLACILWDPCFDAIAFLDAARLLKKKYAPMTHIRMKKNAPKLAPTIVPMGDL